MKAVHSQLVMKSVFIYLLARYTYLERSTTSEKKDLLVACVFIIKVYVKAWFTAPVSTKAPNCDLNFLNQLQATRTLMLKLPM